MTETVLNNLIINFKTQSYLLGNPIVTMLEMETILNKEAEVYIQKLCKNNILVYTVDDLLIGNDGFKELEKHITIHENAFNSFLSQEQDSLRTDRERATIRASEHLTGSGVSVFSNNILGLATASALEYSTMRKQYKKADEQYRKDVTWSIERNTRAREKKRKSIWKKCTTQTLKTCCDLFHLK